jgi:hypothetical protein
MFDDNGDGLFTMRMAWQWLRIVSGRVGVRRSGNRGISRLRRSHSIQRSRSKLSPGSPIPIYAEMFAGSNPLEVLANLRPPATSGHRGRSHQFKPDHPANLTTFRSAESRCLERSDSPSGRGGIVCDHFTARYPYERVSTTPPLPVLRSTRRPKRRTTSTSAILIAGDGEWRTFAQEEVQYSIDVCYKPRIRK